MAWANILLTADECRRVWMRGACDVCARAMLVPTSAQHHGHTTTLHTSTPPQAVGVADLRRSSRTSARHDMLDGCRRLVAPGCTCVRIRVHARLNVSLSLSLSLSLQVLHKPRAQCSTRNRACWRYTVHTTLGSARQPTLPQPRARTASPAPPQHTPVRPSTLVAPTQHALLSTKPCACSARAQHSATLLGQHALPTCWPPRARHTHRNSRRRYARTLVRASVHNRSTHLPTGCKRSPARPLRGGGGACPAHAITAAHTAIGWAGQQWH
jgi:hypothetical protein